jgi:hypothetical protein
VFAYPAPVRARWTDAEISPGARDDYGRLYDALRESHMPEDDHEDPDPVRVHLSRDAKDILVDAIDTHLEETEALGFPARLKGPWSKLEAYLARLCLILAMARAADTGEAERVEDQDVLRAVVLLDYFKNQARRVYVGLYGENPLDGLAEDLATFLKEHGGYWRGEPSEFHAQLESEHKPRRTDELSKMVKAIAARTPALELEYGHEAVERSEGKRTTRRYIALTLSNGVNSVNTEPKASRATDYGGQNCEGETKDATP